MVLLSYAWGSFDDPFGEGTDAREDRHGVFAPWFVAA
jgi:hypothetical protein